MGYHSIWVTCYIGTTVSGHLYRDDQPKDDCPSARTTTLHNKGQFSQGDFPQVLGRYILNVAILQLLPNFSLLLNHIFADRSAALLCCSTTGHWCQRRQLAKRLPPSHKRLLLLLYSAKAPVAWATRRLFAVVRLAREFRDHCTNCTCSDQFQASCARVRSPGRRFVSFTDFLCCVDRMPQGWAECNGQEDGYDYGRNPHYQLRGQFSQCQARYK